MVLVKIFIIFCYPPSFPMVLFCDSCSRGPKVSLALVLILATGSLLVLLRPHHVTATLSPSASIIATTDSAFAVLLRFIFSPNVAPLSVDSLNIYRHCLFCLTTMQHRRFHLIAVGASFWSRSTAAFPATSCCCTSGLAAPVTSKITPKTNNAFKGNRTPLIYRFKPIE